MPTEKKVREIYALDFVVSRVLITIDEQLRPAGVGWKPLGQTFAYELVDQDEQVLDDSDDVTARIYPQGWREHESSITCRIYKYFGEWEVKGGSILIRHLPAFETVVTFDFHKGCPSYFTTKSTGGIDDKIRESARRRRPDLVGKPGHGL